MTPQALSGIANYLLLEATILLEAVAQLTQLGTKTTKLASLERLAKRLIRAALELDPTADNVLIYDWIAVVKDEMKNSDSKPIFSIDST